MAESHVVSGLVSKRSELAGLLLHHQKAMRQLSAAIGNIDGAIKLFDPDYDLRTIKSVAVRKQNSWFGHGETPRMILDALRVTNTPLSTRQIGEHMIAKTGKTVSEAREWNGVLKLVLVSLRGLEAKGQVRMVGKVDGVGNTPILWELV